MERFEYSYNLFQPPPRTVLNPVTVKPKADLHLTSSGIISSCVKCEAAPTSQLSSPTQKSFSDSCLSHLGGSIIPTFPHPPPRCATPEILVSAAESRQRVKDMNETSLLSVNSTRVRKLSHSSEEFDMKEAEEEDEGMQRASSATDLELQLQTRDASSKLTSSKGSLYSPLSPLSPLSSINKETVLAPFSVFAKGVQSLAPGAGKFARGVQSIGVNLDPRKLKLQRQKQLEQDLEMKALKLKCKSRIIQL